MILYLRIYFNYHENQSLMYKYTLDLSPTQQQWHFPTFRLAAARVAVGRSKIYHTVIDYGYTSPNISGIPKMEVLTYISCMDTSYVKENPPLK